MEETRKAFHHELDEIVQEMLRIAATVIESIPRATQVLLDQDLEGAEYMILADDEIDARCIELEEKCYGLLALQQPVAGDLRLIITTVRMIAEVERSADLCVNICKAARRIYGHELDPHLRGLITRMGEQAQVLYREATAAYTAKDAALAAAINDMDDYLDELHREFIQDIFQCHSAGKCDLHVAVQLALIGRFYERIGDHAVNIGEKVRYLATGWLPEHTGAARYRARQTMDVTPPAGYPSVASDEA